MTAFNPDNQLSHLLLLSSQCFEEIGLREVQQFAQGHTASKPQSQGLDTGLYD